MPSIPPQSPSLAVLVPHPMTDLECYLDNAATTPPLPEVVEAARPYLLEDFGNPSSLHPPGMAAQRAVKRAREAVARQVGVPPQAVIFTSGGTESDNLALHGVFHAPGARGQRLLISAFEHPAVGEAAAALARDGVRVEKVPVTRQGVVDLVRLEAMLDREVGMVSCMAVNNELGTTQPLEEIGRLVRAAAPKAVFHVDAVQAFTKGALPWRQAGVHLLSLSGHKVHAPKGVGALVRCRPVPLAPLIYGGGQEGGLRSGTENPFGIVALAAAAELVAEAHRRQAAQRRQYHRNWLQFLAEFPRLRVFRSEAETPFIINFHMAPIPGEVALHHLEQEGLAVSTGSACSTQRPEPSATLLAVGLGEQEALSSLRLSFSLHNTPAGQPAVFQAFRRAMARLAKL